MAAGPRGLWRTRDGTDGRAGGSWAGPREAGPNKALSASTLPSYWDQPVTDPSLLATWTFHFFAGGGGGGAVSKSPERFSGPLSQSARAAVTKVPQAGASTADLSRTARRLKARADPAPGQGQLLGPQGPSAPCDLAWPEGLPGGLLYKGTDPFVRAPPRDRVAPAPSQWGLGFNR